jgi:hypothetical protein
VFSADAAKFGSHGIDLTGASTGSVAQYDLTYGRLELTGTNAAYIPANWTVEFWFKPKTTWNSGTSMPLVAQNAAGDPYSSWGLAYSVGSFAFAANITNSSNGENDTVSITRAANNLAADWHHIAVVRNGATVSIYLDGTRLGEPGNVVVYEGWEPSTFDPATSTFTIPGGLSFGAKYEMMSGGWTSTATMYIDEIRISNVSRYTGATYTVPAAAFPNQA